MPFDRRKESDLDRLHRKKHKVIHQADLFLNKGFGIAHACKQPVVTRFRKGSFADLFFRNEESAALRLKGILRTIGEQRLQALLGEGRDVDHEGRTNISIEARVENLKGAMRRVRFTGSLHFGEPADEARFIAQSSGGVVIGVASLPIGQNDDAWTQTAENGSDLEAILVFVLDIAVGKVEGFAVSDVEDAGCRRGLGCTVGRGAAGAGFALSKVEDTGTPAVGVHGQQSTPAGLFDVVAVGGNGEDVDGRGSRE